jgi:hypothetical protein
MKIPLTILDGKSLDEAIEYLQALKIRFAGQQCMLSNDCVDDISGATSLNLYSVDKA